MFHKSRKKTIADLLQVVVVFSQLLPPRDCWKSACVYSNFAFAVVSK